MAEGRQVLRRAAAGDTAAFEQIVLEHQAMVFSLACHVVRRPERAEEIAQEAFLRLFQNLKRIESPEHLVQWLRKVTWRCAIDELRCTGRGKETTLEGLPEPAAESRPGDVLLEGRLRTLVASLPPRARMIVVLRYQEDLSLAEIAEVMGIPLNTVKSGLARALAVLRGKFNRVAGGVRYEAA